MNFTKKMKIMAVLQGCLVVLMLGVFHYYNSRIKLIWLVFLGVESGILIYCCLKIIKPILELDKFLSGSLQIKREDEKLLLKVEKEIAFIQPIEQLVERSAIQQTRKNLAEILDKQAELTALQSQINPHFLYNTLESIRGQALIDDNVEIAKMVEALASFFRYSISGIGNLVTLREEFSNIQNYMVIQRYRFDNRFSLQINIDDDDESAYDYLIPKLIIQPVVENAIFHGLEEILEGGNVDIDVIVTEQYLILTISDNGKGMDTKALQGINRRIQEGEEYTIENGKQSSGIGLSNIHKRIRLLFGAGYGVQVYSTLNQGTDVEISIPANYKRAER